MAVTPSGTTAYLSLAHPSKVPFLISRRPEERVTVSSLLHIWKASMPNSDTVSGMIISVSPTQPSNACVPMVMRPSGSISSLSHVQPSKAKSFIVTSVEGRFTLGSLPWLNAVFALKALEPISVTG